jgi:DNA polymerase III delta prime subunit
MPPKSTKSKTPVLDIDVELGIKKEIKKISPKSASKSSPRATKNAKKKDDSRSDISAWSVNKEDELRYRSEYKDSVKSLNYKAKINYDEPEESQLWVDIHAPRTLKEYIDDNKNIEKAILWLENFRNKVKNTPAILLLTGKPGIGKTTLAHLIFKEYKYEYKEFNASEARSGKELKEYLEPFNQGNIVTFFDGCEEIKKSLIMDEVDGIDNRGIANDGLSTFLSLTEVTIPNRFKYPIICIANDGGSQKIEKIRKYSLELEMKQPSKNTLIKFLERICKAEKIEIDKSIIIDIVENSEQDFRQVANKISCLVMNVKKDKKGKRVVKQSDFDMIKDVMRTDKKLDLAQILDKIMLESVSIKDTLRLYETDSNIITMSFYSNFTENITKLDVSQKEKIKTMSRISDYLVDGELYGDFNLRNRDSHLSQYQGINQILLPKYLINDLSKKTPTKTVNWDLSGKRIFYLNPHIMDRFWKLGLSLQIYSDNHLAYLVELVWNILKSQKINTQEKVYKKILYRLFDGGLEFKDFENLYKGFTMGQTEIKDCEDVLKNLRPIVKKYFTEHQTIALKEFQANLESIPSQLDQFLSI